MLHILFAKYKVALLVCLFRSLFSFTNRKGQAQSNKHTHQEYCPGLAGCLSLSFLFSVFAHSGTCTATERASILLSSSATLRLCFWLVCVCCIIDTILLTSLINVSLPPPVFIHILFLLQLLIL